MTVVVGTAGHIDHGKTTLLRALTGIDADRLPEERRRGMTIDVGYAHLTLDDGTVVDFVDVPGHDRLVGNMLVGAGEIDASLLVIAADDGPRAQTHEHLALLRALEVAPGLVVVTKTDLVPAERVDEVVAAARGLGGAGVPVVPVAVTTGAGLDDVRAALASMARGVAVVDDGPPRLAIDRAFSIKGRGVVVTGSLRGGSVAVGDRLRLVPGGQTVRVRGIQVHGAAADRVDGGGRTALNLVGVELSDLHRGQVLTADPDVVATDRLLASFGEGEPADRSRWRLHLGTAAVDAVVGRSGRDALPQAGIVRLAAPIAARAGDRFVLRRTGHDPIGGTVLDPMPARGLSRRRQTLGAGRGPCRGATGTLAGWTCTAALIEMGTVQPGDGRRDGRCRRAIAAVEAGPDGTTIGVIRAEVARGIRRDVTLHRAAALQAAAEVVDALVADGRLVREGDRLRRPGAIAAAPDPALLDAMDRLEAALAVPAPPPLAETARRVGCPPDGIRGLERDARIVVLEPDLAYAMSTYRDLAADGPAARRSRTAHPGASCATRPARAASTSWPSSRTSTGARSFGGHPRDTCRDRKRRPPATSQR